MTLIRKTLSVFFIFVALSACATDDKPRPLSEFMPGQLIQHLGLTGADWGYHVADLKTGSTIETRAADTPQPPASTAKLPTMIAAIGILGSEYRFETLLLTNGVITDGVLHGDLMLRGTGDPLLRTNDLRKLAVQLHDQGVRIVTGSFYYESTIPSFPFIEKTQPRSAPYNQGVGGLNIDFNRVRLTALGENAYFLTPTEANGLTPLISNVFPGQVIDIPVNDPGMLVARLFRKFAAFEGITLSAPSPSPPGKTFSPIASVRSLPVSEIVRAGLEYSNNMVSESLGLAAASRIGPPPATLNQSANQLTEWLADNIIGDERFAPFLANHSGLSTKSRITPREMTTLLRQALNSRFNSPRFDTLLPPAGGREGYRGRFRAPEFAFRLWGKTGSMRYIKGLTGYIDTSSGKRLAFSIFTNDLKLRKNVSDKPWSIDDDARKQASEWRIRTEAFESEMISRWISAY